ncbi:MAG: amylo-alpha-1,6-glucosidase, partial [Planctomycetota bacterium]
IAECFLLWCRRGVDGFRCDAGYMVPLPAWQYIIAKVQQRFPDTLFLLEGLGGAWEITESLLTTGGMQWCYSELFQNYDAAAINPYLDYALGQCERRGLWVHYAETHDNDRLAADPDGAAWSLFRNRLCALCSVDGAYGFTAGVEWLAEEKILVHGNTSLNWDAPQHIIDELANVNRLLDDHPCFRDGASCRLHSLGNQRVVVLERRHGEHVVLVLANPDRGNRREVVLPPELASALGEAPQEITGQQSPGLQRRADGSRRSLLPPLSCYCLAPARQAVALDGSAYRRLRAIHTWAVGILSAMLPVHRLPRCDWRELADLADRDHKAFIAACTHLPDGEHPVDLAQLHSRMRHETTPWLSAWSVRDVARELPLPDHHGLVVSHDGPFDVHLQGSKRVRAHRRSVATRDGHVAVFMPNDLAGVEALHLHDIRTGASHRGLLRLLEQRSLEPRPAKMDSCVLLSNGRGAMAWMPVIPHAVTSKYHCALAANLHPDVPMDRHVLIKRLRLWIRHQGFTTPLDDNALAEVQPGPPATWLWRCTFAGGVRVAVRMQADLMHGANTLVLRFEQDGPMPDQTQLIVRVDCEDRSFHAETDLGSNAALAHFRTNTRSLGHGRGFLFQPSSDRRLEVWSDHGTYRAEEEILRRIAHPHEGQRGQRDHGDAWSPGWFELPLDSCQSCCLVATAEAITPKQAEYEAVFRDRRHAQAVAIQRSGAGDYFGQALTVAAQAYVVRRDDGRSVIAGYPWFLDWGRDTLICARGLIAAGLDEEIRGILTVFGRFEENGTLPNAIFGDDARNRDTSDAPLWYGVVCEDLAERHGADIYQTPVDTDGRPIADGLRGIASGYLAGTPNGIRVDADSALVWSPEHFTWMDTSHPAGTPRRGYPVEIQVLWIRLLRLCATLDLSPIPGQADWSDLAARAEAAFHELFWLPELGHHSDCLHAAAGTPARAAVADDALRCNALFGIALGVVSGPHARRAVTAARDWLLVPGAIRHLPTGRDLPLD